MCREIHRTVQLGKATKRWAPDILKGVKFSELVRVLERNGFSLTKEKGSIRYYAKTGFDKLIRVDFHGAKEVPAGTCHAILKAAGLKEGR